MSVCRRFSAFALSSLFAVAASTVARAQIEKGDKSFQLQGQYIQIVSPTSQDPTGIVLGAYSYYLTAKFGIKTTAGLIFASETGYMGGVGLEYNFSSPGQTTIPFVKLDVLDVKFSGVNLLSVAPGAGVRYFMSRNTSIDMTAAYQRAIASFDGGSADGGAIQVLLGFSYFFGGGNRR
ncbi:MAG: hypothetical protein HYX65_09445 [Gemmatimonadetes bacterium]|nr:hypothetical protein [Gemmatimonadota bacterium]